ncbi:MAG TPA: DUF4381 family protein [Luteimonas sp.]|nr:DUF4381 family protein [Luteimonas sp.]
MALQELPLRDIHQPPPPPWWPPAPGWWLLAALLIAALAFGLWWWRRARRRRARIVRLFDERVHAAATPVARVAAMSELLRRAARRVDPRADRLQDEDWLAFLDGGAPGATAQRERAFSQGPGRVLLDGGFRRELGEADAAALLPLARARYLQLMAARR